MNLTAQILAGDPPAGVGAFLRDEYVPGRWNFVLVNAWRSDALQLVQTARAAGLGVWLYGTPDVFTPALWRASLALMLSRIDTLGADGGIVDAEDGWQGQDAEARALGQAMHDAAVNYRLGFTSYPAWGPLAAFASTAGESVFGVPQMYGHSLPGPIDAPTVRAWWARWQAFFGARLVPAIAGWVANSLQQTQSGYHAYLSYIPSAPGAMVWLEAGGGPPSFIRDELANYQPGGSSVGTLAQSALVFVARPAGLVTLAVLAVALLTVGFVVWGVARGA